MGDGAEIYAWKDYRVNVVRRTVHRGAEQLKLIGLPFDVLVYLVANQNRMVSKQEIFDAVWKSRPGTVFDPNLIDRAISTIRIALGAEEGSPSLRVERGKGVIFDALVSPVTEVPTSTADREESGQISSRKPRRDFRLLVIAGVVVIGVVLVVWLGKLSGPKIVVDLHPLTNSGNPKIAPLVIAENPHRVLFTELVGGRYQISWVEPGTRKTGKLQTDIANPTVLAISPDGRNLLVRNIVTGVQDDSPLLLQPMDIGIAKPLGIVGYDGAWSPDGSWMALTRDGAIIRYRPADNKIEDLFRTGSGYAYWPRFSPNGRVLRFSILDGNPQVNSLWELDLETRKAKQISPSGGEWVTAGAGSWSSDGRLFYFQCGQGSGAFTIWWMPANRNIWNLLVNPQQLTTGPISFRAPQPDTITQHVFARGQLVRAEMTRISLTDGSTQVVIPDTSAAVVSYSRDGKRLVYYATNPEEALWKATAAGTERQLLIPRPIQSSMPQWSPDGKQIAVSTRYPGRAWGLTLISDTDNSQEEIPTISTNVISPTWTPDGKQIIFGTIPTVEKDSSKIMLYRLDLDTKKISSVPGSQGLYMPALSPNGNYLAALTADASTIRVLDIMHDRWLPASASRANFLAWAKDSSSVLFVSGDRNGALEIKRCSVPAMETAVVQLILNFKQFSSWIGTAPDGSFLMPRDLSTQEIYQLVTR